MLIAHVIRDKGATVYTLTVDATLEDAARELNTKRVGALVVLDAHGRLMGVLSERDIVRQVAKNGAACLGESIDSAMTRDVITARTSETVDECLARMTDRRIRHLPVVAEGQLMGLVSIGDLVKHRIAAAEAESAAMQAYIAAH